MGLEDEVDKILAAEAAAKEASARLWQEIDNRANEPPDEKNWLVRVNDELQVLLEEFSAFMLAQGIKPLPLVTAQSRGIGRSRNFREETTFKPAGYGGWQLHTIGVSHRRLTDFDAFVVTEKSELVLALLANRKMLKADNWAYFDRYCSHYRPGLKLAHPPFKIALRCDFRFIHGINEMLVLRPGEQGSIGSGQTDRYWHPPGVSLGQFPLTPTSVLFHKVYIGMDYEDSKTIIVKDALRQPIQEIKAHELGLTPQVRKKKELPAALQFILVWFILVASILLIIGLVHYWPDITQWWNDFWSSLLQGPHL